MQLQFTDALPPQLQATLGRYWQQLLDHPQTKATGLEQLITANAKFHQELVRVWIASDYVANATLSEPQLLHEIFARRESASEDYQLRLDAELESLCGSDYKKSSELLKAQLRRFHRREFILIIWRDICDYADVHEVCQQMSELADSLIHASLSILHEWSSQEWGVPVAEGIPQSLVVIGMGKLGAFELNVSSDIDLIFAYPNTGNTQPSSPGADPLTNQQYFIRLGQRLIDCLDTTTVDGFLFRVDMRLRPYGSEGALVLNFDAMEDYYQNQGRDWERYAFIKARAVAGDLEQGKKLLKRLKPFVYRRYLDFAMFDSLRDMKIQIDKQARRGKQQTDIKLGPGGIREVEFIIQALQLVYGGRDSTLQVPSIVQAARNLTLGNYLPEVTTSGLMSAYVYLRRLEHRLQALGNQQTQSLPVNPDQQFRVAHAMGYQGFDELLNALNDTRSSVSNHFRAVLRSDEDNEQAQQSTIDWAPLWQQVIPQDEAVVMLEQAGYEDPQGSFELLEAYRKDKKFLTLAAEGRSRLKTFMPVLLDAVARSDKPSLCLSRVMVLVESVSRRTAYLILLLENPQALNQLVVYCTASPLISTLLSKYPVLLDELLHPLNEPPEKASLAEELKLQLLRIEESSLEQQLDCLLYFKQSHLLQVAAAEVSKEMPLMKVSDYLTFTAEVILDAVLALSWQHLIAKHGYPVHTDGRYGEPSFAIIGYGKLGGIELSYNSDLDLVFLHQGAIDEDTVVSGTQTSVNSRAFYIKLAQKIISTLGTYTVSGKLYEVDMRLRPSGDSGLLVSSTESFLQYQLNEAWTWEHQALVRARGVAGNSNLLEEFRSVRASVLSQYRDINVLANDVISMRDRMRKELGSNSTTSSDKIAFAIKQGKGGIVDIEFLVQYLVLAHANEFPDLLTFTDNFRILEQARKSALLDESDMNTLIKAYLELRSASHLVALQQNEGMPETETLNELQHSVTNIWDRVFRETLNK